MASTGKRSRTGCSVCLTRKRKCDEDWRENGSCQRCHKAGLECVRMPPRPPAETSRVLPELRYLEPAKLPLQTSNTRGKTSTSNTPMHNPIPSTSSSSSLPTDIPLTNLPTAFQPPPFRLEPTKQPTAGPAYSVPPELLPPLDAFNFPISLPGPTVSEFHQYPAQQQSYPFLPALDSGPRQPELDLFDPWAFADQMDVSEYGVTVNSAANNTRIGIEMSLGAKAGSEGLFGRPENLNPVDDIEQAGSEAEVYKLYASVNVFRDPLYVSLNDVFLRSFPWSLRRTIHEYYDSQMSQHELNRAAALAVTLLYYARNQPNGSPKQKRLLVHSRSMLLRALDILRKTPSLPLEVVLMGTLDLAYCQIESIGGAGVGEIMSIASLFAKAGLGENYILDFLPVVARRQIALLFFAYYDILRAIVMPVPDPVLKQFKWLPGSRMTTPAEATQREIWLKEVAANPMSVHHGLPVALVICFAGITTLATEMAKLDIAETRRRANEIEESIRTWRAEIHYDDDEDLASYKAIVEATTQEMWRQAALIYLHSTIHKIGFMAQALRNPTLQIIQLGTITYRKESGELDLHSSMSRRACPWFLAATCAISPQEREQCRIGLKMCGTHRGFRETLEAAEFIWARVDREGHTFDWRMALVEARLYPCFL
ncbi:hypothetical protein T439DRAFT_383492 [Meredithblackwellia eburnea MCA 4105]